ncbi:MAG: cytochrome b/b6 domain-containing protein, partial [Rhodospirillaceae bacterium]|nr:cytochrome b/b6 domain-containing protein [Rhodospirillaceae bacterium]
MLAMIIIHIYFAIRPEKLWITRSMIWGWITRAEYT